MKAVALFSGGLDSILAVKLVEVQGVEVVPIHIYTWFAGRKGKAFAEECQKLYGIRPVLADEEKRFFEEVLFNAKYGYGQGFNPCIDCKIFFFKVAKRFMEETGAVFVVSGEVLGQRPMSQRRNAFELIEKESGLKGLVVRPLSAKLLPPSIPEQKGWVKRDLLEGIHGRGRKRQLELAKHFGIKKIPSPAGGCILTDPTFSRRLRTLLEIKEKPTLDEVKLLRKGRMFKIGSCIVVVSRSKEEARSSAFSDAWRDQEGKVAAVTVGNCKGCEKLVAGILLRYARRKSGIVYVGDRMLKAEALSPEKVHEYLV